MNRMVAALLVSAGAVAVSGGCGTTSAGAPVTVVREIVAPPATSVVVVAPPVTVTRASSLTSCRRLFGDGYPCEQSYGNRN